MKKLTMPDVFRFIRLINSTGTKDELKKSLTDMLNGNKRVISAEDDGADIILAIISAFGNKGAEYAFYEFLSGPFEMSVEEVQNLDPRQCLNMIKELATVEEWTSFFKSAVKLDNTNR